MAHDLVARYGLSPALGPGRLLAADTHLGASGRLGPVGPATADTVDAEVRRLLEEVMAQAGRLLNKHRARLDHLVKALEADEQLNGPVLARLLAGTASATVQVGGGGEPATCAGSRRGR
ncbi:MAG: hypothetical protein H7323_06020 [Frankiales bacterium]|nr:hypothetical protein [Frankiales bacterium]